MSKVCSEEMNATIVEKKMIGDSSAPVGIQGQQHRSHDGQHACPAQHHLAAALCAMCQGVGGKPLTQLADCIGMKGFPTVHTYLHTGLRPDDAVTSCDCFLRERPAMASINRQLAAK